jgi:hypothetical protein
VAGLLWLVRRVAPTLDPWVERLPPAPLEAWGTAALQRQLAADVEVRPLKQGEVVLALADLRGVLAVECIRLAWLLRAPWACFPPNAWSGCVAREWALMVTLARIGQAYFALEGLFGVEVAEPVWQQQLQQVEAMFAPRRAAAA